MDIYMQANVPQTDGATPLLKNILSKMQFCYCKIAFLMVCYTRFTRKEVVK